MIIDNRNAAFNAVKHLYKEGYRRIAFLDGPENVQIRNHRINGYTDALRGFGLEIIPGFIKHANFTRDDAADKTNQLLMQAKKPDAIIVFSDQLAIAAILCIKQAG